MNDRQRVLSACVEIFEPFSRFSCVPENFGQIIGSLLCAPLREIWVEIGTILFLDGYLHILAKKLNEIVVAYCLDMQIKFYCQKVTVM